MNAAIQKCGKCFEHGVKFEQAACSGKDEAMFLYGELIREGLLPNLCQSHDGRYRVCHESRNVAGIASHVREAAYQG